METWHQIIDFDGVYEASDAGRIRNTSTGKVLAPIKNGPGYHYMNLCLRGVRFKVAVHRAVWAAFNGPIPEGMEINHLNGDKLDNRLPNLQCCTHSENVRHSHRVLGRKFGGKLGADHSRALLTEADVLTIRDIYAKRAMTQAAIARSYGVSKGCIEGICRRKNWRHI
jgi:hypothetical protein